LSFNFKLEFSNKYKRKLQLGRYLSEKFRPEQFHSDQVINFTLKSCTKVDQPINVFKEKNVPNPPFFVIFTQLNLNIKNMSDNSSSSGFAFIAGLVVGGAVGAIAGLLFAPETGEETRKKVTEKSKEWADEFNNKFDDLKDSMTEVMEDVKKGSAEVMEDVKKGAVEVLDDVKKTVGKKA